MRFQSFRAWIVSAVFVFGAVTLAHQASSQGNSNGDEQQVKAAQQQLLQAVQQGDKQAEGRLIADNVTWVAADGKVNNKEQILSATGPAPREVTVEDVRPFDKTAIVTGTAHFEDGRDARFLQEWINQDGQWKLLAHEGSLIGTPASATGTSGSGSSAETSGKPSAAATTRRSEPPTLNSDAERAVWKTQQDLVQAFLKGDSTTYGKLTTEDYIRVGVNGKRLSRNDTLRMVKDNAGKSGGNIEAGDAQITVNGDTARLVMSNWGTLPGGEQLAPERVTRIFVKRNGEWQQAAIAFTRMRD